MCVIQHIPDWIRHRYRWYIQAFNVAGFSDFTGVTVRALSDAPAGLTATPGDRRVALTWDPAVGADSYVVYRSLPGDAPQELQRGVTDTTFTDTTALNGTTYTYFVTSVNPSGESAPADGVNATPAGVPGTYVSDVAVRGTNWNSAFMGYLAGAGLGTDGYTVSAASSGPLPWSDVSQFRVHFDRDVAVHSADLSVHGVNVASYPVTGFVYDPAAHTATWTLAQPVTDDRLTLSLAGDGANRQTFSSSLSVLTGDVDRNGVVNAQDAADVRRRLGSSTTGTGTGAGAYSAFDDVNGDGRINALDQTLVLRRMGQALPAAPAAPAAAPGVPVSPPAPLRRVPTVRSELLG